MKKILAGLLILSVVSALGFPLQAAGGGWIPAGENDDFAVYLDDGSAKMISETSSKIWMKIVAKSDRYKKDFLQSRKQQGMPVDGYRNYSYTLESLEIECSGDRQRTLETADYDADDHKIGEAFPISGWRHITPGTIVAGVAVALCREHAVSNTWWWDYPEHESHEEE